MNEIDITGLDKKEILKQLWLGSEPAIVFTMNNIEPPKYNEKEAELAIEKGYVDYLCGRAIKSEIGTNKLDSYIYDKYNGYGAMEEAVDIVRNKK
jgi:hypothetical protein